MNKNCTIKHLLILLIFAFIPSFAFSQCITSLDIVTENVIDNGNGTCTYEVTITVTHFMEVERIRIDGIPLPPELVIENCNGGDCNNIAPSPSGITVVTASVTKPCDDEVDIYARGIIGGLGCGADGFRFSGDQQLPAELTAFKAFQGSKSNTLLWETASEENTLIFIVQRSVGDDNSFETIGRVEAIGYSTSSQSYDFTDADPVSISYYRLQIVDYDGSSEFSDVLVVERAKPEIDQVEVFPVPAIDSEVTVLIHSKKEGPAFIDLFDRTGRSVKQERIELKAGINRVILDWESEEGNFYFFTIYNGKERISKKILMSNLD